MRKVRGHYIISFYDGDTGKERAVTVRKTDIESGYNWTPFINMGLKSLEEDEQSNGDTNGV